MRCSKLIYFWIFTLVLLVPLMLWRDFTPDNELRYLSIADEALRNGSLFAFSNHGVAYADKPPLYLWLLMACRTVLGGWFMLPLALLSVVPALVTATVMCRWTEKEMPENSRLTAMAVLLTTGMMAGAAIVVRMDMLMTMFIVLAVRTFYDMYEGRGDRKVQRWLFPLYMFLALFTKGPLGLLLPVVGITVFLAAKKDLRRWPVFFGWQTWSVLIVLSAIWFMAVYIEGGREYLDNLLFHQTMDRAVNAFHHKRPVWYYCVALLYCLAPWTLLFIVSIIAGVRRKLFDTDLKKLLPAMSASTFVLLSCISSKLAVYVLPMLPFAVYMMMLVMPKVERFSLARLSVGVPVAAFVFALPAVLFLTGQTGFNGFVLPGFIAAGSILTVTGVAALFVLFRRQPLQHVMLLIATGIGLAVFCAGLSINDLNPMIGYKSGCREAQDMSNKYNAPIIVDENVKNAADMDVYLKHFKIVKPESIEHAAVVEKYVLISNGTDGAKLKCTLVRRIR